MPRWLLILIVLVLGLVLYSALNTLLKARASKRLMANERPFALASTDYRVSLLVLGDSTGVGVGASTPEDSVAGRLAHHIGATYVENHAVSGAAVEDLSSQLGKIQRDTYTYILVHIGGNDILGFNDPKKVAPRLRELLATLPKTEKVIVLSAGNVGGATIFPRIVRFFHTRLTLQYHAAFETALAGVATYVNLYEPRERDPFLKDPQLYLAEDGLHPSSEGYRLWFEKVKEVL